MQGNISQLCGVAACYAGGMKYIIFTYDGHGLPIAHRLQQEGCEVLVGQVEDKRDTLSSIEHEAAETLDQKRKRLQLFDGLLSKRSAREMITHMKTIKDPENYFVFFDLNNLYKFADEVQDLGFHGNFPTEDDLLLEIDRNRAKQFAAEKYSRLHVGTTKNFTKAAEAIDFLSSSDDLWVLKGKDDAARTIVPESSDSRLANRQLMEVLESTPAPYEKTGYILELLIPTIVELTPEKMYYNGVPVATTVDIENKPLGSGNIGIQTGCAADLVFPTAFEDKLNQIAFPPFVDELAMQHKGLFIWDASILIDSKSGKMYFGEYCSNRPGYNCLFTEIAMAGSANGFFESIVKGKNPFNPGMVGASVRMFNLNHDETSGNILADKQIMYKDELAKNIWLWDAYKDKERIKCVGFDKNLAVITAAGNSIEETVGRLYRTVEGFSFEGVYYRPQFDFVSKDYGSSILNRLNYGLQRNLYKIGFAV